MSDLNEVVVAGADSAIAKRDVAGDIVSKMQDEWGKVLPSICTPERFARMALSCVRKNAVLGEAIQTPQGKISVLDAFMKCAELGIEPDGRRAHLIPYKNTKTGGYTITLIIDYKGIAELVMRSGLVSYIHADKVCENDVFECNKGKIEVHKPNYKMPRGKPYAYYALVVLKDGTEKSEIMTVDEVEAIRSRSRSANNGPWVTDFDEMSKKTTFKRLAKWLPLSPEVKTAIEEDDKDYIDVVTIPEKRSKFETQKAGNALLSVVKEDAVIEEPAVIKSETVVSPEQSEISKAIAGNYAGVTVEQFKAYMAENNITIRDAIANKDNIIGILADKIPL
jgi:recombination protein RecT